jgi:nitrogen fixation NifU-like protein
MPESGVYDELIMDHIKNARNFRVFDDATHRASAENPLCGDEMSILVRVDSGSIGDIGFQCTCCGISMASASIMTEMMIGQTKAHARDLVGYFKSLVASPDAAFEFPDSAEWRALAETLRRFPARIQCASLPWSVLESVLSTPD